MAGDTRERRGHRVREEVEYVISRAPRTLGFLAGAVGLLLLAGIAHGIYTGKGLSYYPEEPRSIFPM